MHCWPHFDPLLAPFWPPKSIKFRPGTKNVTFAFWASRLDESSTLGVQGPQKPPKVPPKAIKKSIKFQLWFFSDFWCKNGSEMIPKWGGEKWLFHHGAPPGTTSRPRGTLGPPKAHFWSQNGVPRAPWDPKSLPKWPPRDPRDPQILKKTAKNYEKGSHKYIQIVFVQQREKHHQQTQKRNSWNNSKQSRQTKH